MKEVGFFVINLAASKDRLDAVSESFSRAELSFERVEAVDYRTDRAQLRAAYDGKFSLAGGCFLSDAYIAISLSHIRALKAFLASGKPFGAIVEDDAVFGAAMPALIRRLVLAKQAGELDFDGVELMGREGKRKDLLVPVTSYKHFNIFKPSKTTPVSGFMLYSRAGAKKLLDKALPLRTHWDNYVSLSWRHGVRYLTVSPYPAFEMADNSSTYRHTLKKEAGPRAWDLLKRRCFSAYAGAHKYFFNLRWLGGPALFGSRAPAYQREADRDPTLFHQDTDKSLAN